MSLGRTEQIEIFQDWGRGYTALNSLRYTYLEAT